MDLTADTLITKGTALAEVGRVLEGRGVIQAGIDIAERQGWPAIALRGRVNLTYVLALRDPRQAMATAKAGFEDAQRLGIRALQATLHVNAADSAIRVGEWDWAIEVVEPLLATGARGRGPINALMSVLLTIRALRGEVTEAELERPRGSARGRCPIARSRSPGASPGCRPTSPAGGGTTSSARCLELVSFDRISGTAYLFLAGRVAVWRRDTAALRRLIDRHEGCGVHGQAISAERVTMRAGLAALEGRTTDAHMGYREALDRWRDLGLEWDEAMTGLEMATVLDRPSPMSRRRSSRSTGDLRAPAGATVPRASRGDRRCRPPRPSRSRGESDRGQRGTDLRTRLTVSARPASTPASLARPDDRARPDRGAPGVDAARAAVRPVLRGRRRAGGRVALHHDLVDGQIGHGLVNYLVVFFAIWWAWMNFTWFASAYDTDDVPYRLLDVRADGRRARRRRRCPGGVRRAGLHRRWSSATSSCASRWWRSGCAPPARTRSGAAGRAALRGRDHAHPGRLGRSAC